MFEILQRGINTIETPLSTVYYDPIRPQTDKGRVIFTQNYDNLEIVVKRLFGVTELIVNGMVYAEKKGVIETEYTLEVSVDNISIKVIMSLYAMMCLYINGKLIAKKHRIF